MDENVLRVFNELLRVLGSLNERVGVPQTVDTPDMVLSESNTPATIANIWGKELEIGKYFPDDTDASFLKPLFEGLDNLFAKYYGGVISSFIAPPTIGSNSIFGFDSVLLLKISNNLGLSVPGLNAFKNLDWELVANAISYLDETVLNLTLMEPRVIKAVSVSENLTKLWGNLASAMGGIVLGEAISNTVKSLVAVTGALGAVAGGLLLFGALSWDNIAKGIVTLGSFGFLIKLLGSAGGFNGLLGTAVIAALGLSLIPLSIGLKGFQSLEWETLGKAGATLGVLTAVVVGLGVPAVAALAALGSGVLVIMSGAFSILGMSLKYLLSLPLDKLPAAGTALSGFLTNLTSNIGLLTGGKLVALVPTLLGLSGSIASIATAVNFLIPSLPAFDKFITSISNVNTESIDMVARSIRGISDAINGIGFAKLSLLASSLGKISFTVDAFGPETAKTNTILSEQLAIQKLLLEETRKQTVALGNINMGGPISQGPSGAGVGSFKNTIQNFKTSSYYIG